MPIPRKSYAAVNNSGPHITILIKKHGLASCFTIFITLAHRTGMAFNTAKATAENLVGNGQVYNIHKTPELSITDLRDLFLFPLFCFNQSYRQVRLNELLQEHSRAANLIVL